MPPDDSSTDDVGSEPPLNRYEAFDQLADQVNSGTLSMLGAKALWFELACPDPQDPLVHTDTGQR